MELNVAINSIIDKIYDWTAMMTREEAEVLKANLDDPEVKCYYALGLFISSSCRFTPVFDTFLGYDKLQEEAFALLDQAISDGCALAVFYLAQVKCGLFGKFPMYPDEGKALLEKYYALTGNESIKASMLDNWDTYLKEMKEYFDDLKFTEKCRRLNIGPNGLGNHDEAYYESLSEDDKKE